MTTRTFFDKGVYKSTLKRFSLGSILYFIMLFLCTGMIILLAYEPHRAVETSTYRRLFLDDGFMYIAMCIDFVVPTVVALLCYRFVHSKKNSIFTHSLPVTKKANYISTLAGAFTLMALPVIANTVVLYVISLCGYGNYFESGDIMLWTLFNLFVLFVMFSLSTFSAMCTGNSFALVVLNAIFVFVPLLIASITETILVEFLYGYSYTRNLLEFASEINPAVFITEMAEDISSRGATIDHMNVGCFIAFAVVLYVLSGVLYKFRHTETSEEVAGFKVLNPIFKYFITFVGTLSVFSLFSQFLGEKSVLFTFIVILASVIFYFGSEMILKKTVKVWNSYKGYLAFGAVFTLFILFLGLTSVFGYETYVPEFEDIEEAAIYNYYYQAEEPFTSNEALNRYIIAVHSDFAAKENRPILNHDDYQDTRIHITYKLKNGKTVTRRYGVSNSKNDEIMSEVYNYTEYKEACEAVFDERIKEIESISIATYDISDKDGALNEIFECIKADVAALSYSKLRVGSGASCSIRWIYDAETDNSHYPLEDLMYYDWTDFRMTKYYENTIKWLEENGYGHIVIRLLGASSSLDYTTVELADMGDVELCYHAGDIDIDCAIEDETEIEALREIFEGYYIEQPNSEKLFDDDISVSFGGGEIWFCPALDGSASFRLNNTDMYISVTDDEMARFNAIVEKYGMVLPCI